MLCSRCVLPFLTLYILLEEISAAFLPSRNKREMNWLEHDLFPRLPDRSDEGDLSVGDAGEIRRDLDVHKSRSETFVAPTENFTQRQNHQYQYNRKANEKRRKVAPMDPIGSFQMSSSRNRKDEPDMDREEFRE